MYLETKSLAFSIKDNILIEDINVQFASGHLYGILGPNGSGKSTFLKTLSGIWKPSNGFVLLNHHNLLNKTRKEISKLITLVPQNPVIHFDYTVTETVAMGSYLHQLSPQDEMRLVEQVLKETDAWHLKDRWLSQLSGGERQRIYIARALAVQAPILLLDEPTAHLDLRHQLEIWHLLKHLAHQGRIIIAAIHDLGAAKRYCEQVVLLHHGRCLSQGTYPSVMTEENLQKVFGVSSVTIPSEIYY